MIKLTRTSTPNMFSVRMLAESGNSRTAEAAAKAADDATTVAAELQEALQNSRQEQAAASEEAKGRERELEESLRETEKVGHPPPGERLMPYPLVDTFAICSEK